jgi:hypothetical protein
MQLINSKQRNLISLTITGGIVASSYAFSYNALTSIVVQDIISSPITESFVSQTQENNYVDLSRRLTFNNLLNSWRNNTIFMSFADQIVNEPNFKKIVSMGENVVPFIIEEISHNPSPLVWALNFIYDKTISNRNNLTIEEACKLWVKAMQ